MTWKEAWKRGAQSLQKAGVEEYDLDAWYLLEHVTGITKASYYMEPEHPMHDQEEREYLELIRKRSTRIPLQHLTGVQEFMGLEFLVNEHVLIPRQDTETLVEEALKHLGDVEKPEILDMCTGSGCILLSLLLERQDACGTGVDVSPEALEVAKKECRYSKRWRTGRILWKAICSQHRIFVKKVEKIVGNMISLFQTRLISQQKKLKH